MKRAGKAVLLFCAVADLLVAFGLWTHWSRYSGPDLPDLGIQSAAMPLGDVVILAVLAGLHLFGFWLLRRGKA